MSLPANDQRKPLLSGRDEDQPADANELESKRVLLVLAQGFEDAEAACALDVLGWTHYRPSVATVQVETIGFHESVRGAFGTTVAADTVIDWEVGHTLNGWLEERAIDALVIPGGFHNLGYDEAYDERICELARAAHERGCPIATMCVGVLPVAKAGVLQGGRATTYALSSRHDNPGFLEEHGCAYEASSLVESKGVISCSGPAFSENVMMRLLGLLAGPQAVKEVARYRNG